MGPNNDREGEGLDSMYFSSEPNDTDNDSSNDTGDSGSDTDMGAGYDSAD
jgi:hypothetical protein